MPIYHPHQDEHGKPVLIKHPSTPTTAEAWQDAAAIATAIPGGQMPAIINGILVSPWTDHPKTAEGWNAITSQQLDQEEPPLKQAPGFKASAGIVILESDGRVWIVAPTNHFGGYEWTFPKGTVTQDMTLHATAICEAMEESGLQVRITALLGDFTRTTSVCRLYLGERIGGSPASMGWESQAASLVPLDALPRLLNGAADKPVIEALRKYFPIGNGEILAGGGNIVRTLQAIDGFYATYREWPTHLQMSANHLATLVTHHLSPKGFFKLQSKIKLVVEDGNLIASSTSNRTFNYSRHGWDVHNTRLLAREWLGI
jgi:ADP-ribose pyrophosphatase YjhB (NUDIX family)